MPETETTSPAQSTKILGVAALYESNKCLTFSFPEMMTELVDAKTGYGLVPHADGTWEIVPDKGRAKLRRRAGSNTGWRLTFSMISRTREYFGSTPCEYIVVDDRILASLIGIPRPVTLAIGLSRDAIERQQAEERARAEERVRLARSMLGYTNVDWKQKLLQSRLPEAEAPVPVEVSNYWAAIKLAPPGDKQILHALLNYLVRTEAQTDWRLVKVDGGWRLRRDEIVPDPE